MQCRCVYIYDLACIIIKLWLLFIIIKIALKINFFFSVVIQYNRRILRERDTGWKILFVVNRT